MIRFTKAMELKLISANPNSSVISFTECFRMGEERIAKIIKDNGDDTVDLEFADESVARKVPRKCFICIAGSRK